MCGLYNCRIVQAIYECSFMAGEVVLVNIDLNNVLGDV